jgi:hypothetical protein
VLSQVCVASAIDKENAMTMQIATPGISPLEVDHDSRDGEIARRNVLFGLWAGRRLGLAGDELELYAWSVHFADRDRPGHDDVIAKVRVDLAARGVPLREQGLRERLREMQLRASLELAPD